MIIGNDNLNINGMSESHDVVLGRSSDSEVNRRVLINNILNSSKVSDVYTYSQGDSNYVINVEFDESTNTFIFSFSDGEVLVAKINTDAPEGSPEYATIEYVNEKVSSSLSNLQWKESVPTYSDIKSRYPNPSDGWTVNVDDSDITYRYTGNEWIPISSNSIPLSSEDKNGLMSSSDKKKLDSLENYDDSEIKEQLENSVKYQSFDVNRKTIQLSNHDTISGVTTKGLGVNIAMVSKWDKVDLGSPQVEINLNGSKERPTYNDVDEIALTRDLNSIGVHSLGVLGSFNDVPDALANKDICTNAKNVIITFVVSNSTYGDEGGFCTNIYTQNNVYQTLYWKNKVQERTLKLLDGEVQLSEFKNKVDFTSSLPNKAVKGPKLFSLTTDSSEDEIKSALTSTISNSLITSSDLDECLNKGLVVKEEVMSGSVIIGWNGSSYTFTEVGLTSPKSDLSLKSVVISITPEGKYSVVKNGSSSLIITKNNISSQLGTYLTKEDASKTYQLKDDVATSSKNGVMSKEDKSKLDGLNSITKVSQLENDSNYLTESILSSKDYLTKSDAASTYVAISDLERLVNEIISKSNQ